MAFFDFLDPVKEFFFGEDEPPFREPTAQETRLTDLQIQGIEEARAREQATTPFILAMLGKQAGFIPRFDQQGNVVGLDPVEATEAEQRQKEIQKGFEERTLAGLAGEIEIDPLVTREYDFAREDLKESLLKQLGPGYETSTPGQAGLERFESGRLATLGQLARGELGASEGRALARSGQQERTAQLNLANLFGLEGLGAGIGSRAGNLSNILAGERALGTQYDIATNQPEGAMKALFGGAGSGVGAYLTKYLLT